MGLVLEIHQPLFSLSVDLHRNYDTAGVDLIGFLLIFQPAFFFQLPHGHQSQIHQADKFIVSSLENLLVILQILLIGCFHGLAVIAVAESHIFKLCGEGGMTAVVGPVGIQHTDLCHGRIAFLFIFIIILNMKKILKGHSKI